MSYKLPKLITPTEASKILGVTEETLSVWRCTKRYPLPYVKIGGKVMYQEEDLKKFITFCEVNPDE